MVSPRDFGHLWLFRRLHLGMSCMPSCLFLSWMQFPSQRGSVETHRSSSRSRSSQKKKLEWLAHVSSALPLWSFKNYQKVRPNITLRKRPRTTKLSAQGGEHSLQQRKRKACFQSSTTSTVGSSTSSNSSASNGLLSQPLEHRFAMSRWRPGSRALHGALAHASSPLSPPSPACRTFTASIPW